MTDRKLIVPVELKVCATCSYWDGARSVDDEVRVVVVCESCAGECLIRQAPTLPMRPVLDDAECLWDAADDSEGPAGADQAHKTGS